MRCSMRMSLLLRRNPISATVQMSRQSFLLRSILKHPGIHCHRRRQICEPYLLHAADLGISSVVLLFWGGAGHLAMCSLCCWPCALLLLAVLVEFLKCLSYILAIFTIAWSEPLSSYSNPLTLFHHLPGEWDSGLRVHLKALGAYTFLFLSLLSSLAAMPCRYYLRRSESLPV
jgi:hypothetical protein